MNLTSKRTIEESGYSEYHETESKTLASKTFHGKAKHRSSSQNKDSRGKCYRCDKHGNFARLSTSQTKKDEYYRCDQYGHCAKECPDRKQNEVSGSSQPEGYIREALASTTPADAGVETWYMDSGARDHISHT